jgi:hypothetical protein
VGLGADLPAVVMTSRSKPLAPPIVTSGAEHWRCEGCKRGIMTGDRVYLWDDDVVTHVACPAKVQA